MVKGLGNYLGFWGLVLRKTWQAFQGTIDSIGSAIVLLAIIGIAIGPILLKWAERQENGVIKWYLANPWVAPLIIFSMLLFFYGTYRVYSQEKASHSMTKAELVKFTGEDAARDRRIKEAQAPDVQMHQPGEGDKR